MAKDGKWERDGLFFKPTFPLKCRGCKDPNAKMKRLRIVLLNFPLNYLHMGEDNAYDGHAQDYTFVCDLCGWQSMYGVAIDEAHYKECFKDGKKRNAPTWYR